jgi:hypothetical protein
MTEIHSCSYYCDRSECIRAQRDELRSRLAQPEQEPVFDCPRCGHCCPQRTWVGLTDEEVKNEWVVWRASLPRYVGFAKGIEAKLKEKNT